jgi:Ala-tRNA(Pro) deacylase
MAATPQTLFALLDRLGIAHSTVTHPAMFTVEEGREIVAKIPGAHTKNLFLKDKNGQRYLIVALQHTRIDLKGLPGRIGSGRLSFGSAVLLRATLKVEPGSVTPFALVNDTEGVVRVVLDDAMMSHDILNFHPLINTMTTAIGRDALVRFLRATGHEPQIVAFDPLPGD